MNQNNIMVRLISLKEQLNIFFEKRGRVAYPLIKGLLTLCVLLLTCRLFPYKGVIDHPSIMIVLSVLQAFLPIPFLYYIVSAVILCNLWKVSFDIFIAFAVFVIVCIIGYFRIDARYSYLAVIVPVLFFLKLEILIPAAIALLFGIGALFPVAVGTVIYYFSCTLTDSYALLSSSDSSVVGVGLQRVMVDLVARQEFFVVLSCICLSFIVTCLFRCMFYERAWLLAVIAGNVSMAFCLLVGRLYFEVSIPVGLILLEAVVGVFLCSCIEFFRGIGDVSRIEKTVFEDDEYIYYVKAVPKMKLSVSQPNVKIMNEEISETKEASRQTVVESIDETDVEESIKENTEEISEENAEKLPEENKETMEDSAEKLPEENKETMEESAEKLPEENKETVKESTEKLPEETLEESIE